MPWFITAGFFLLWFCLVVVFLHFLALFHTVVESRKVWLIKEGVPIFAIETDKREKEMWEIK